MKTTGVVEHTFTLRGGAIRTLMDWKIYDAGGELSQRQAWAPYFDDVKTIIFLGACGDPCFEGRRSDPSIW
jgi:hypothetical protein